jgi:pimeloyl-ACP methyl ester carboxylesterase
MKLQKKLAFGYIRAKLNLLSFINKRLAGEKAFELFCTPLVRYNGNGSELFLKSERLAFELNGKMIRGFRCNHPGQKTALILHGFSSTCHKFDRYAADLVKKGYEVLAFDAPAHGASEGKTVHALEYSRMIQQVVALYGPVQSYIGHSFGGMAASLALEELPHDEHTKLVLIAPATETSSAIESAFAMLGLKNPAVRKALDDVIAGISGKDTQWFSIRRAITNIRASVLWVHDEADDITPLKDALQVKAADHANVEFYITKGLGHQKIYRDAAVRERIIRFL